MRAWKDLVVAWFKKPRSQEAEKSSKKTGVGVSAFGHAMWAAYVGGRDAFPRVRRARSITILFLR